MLWCMNWEESPGFSHGEDVKVTGGISVEADSPEEAREYFESEDGQEAVAMRLQPEAATITEITEDNDEDLDAESCVLVCEDCESTDCAYNNGGVCKFPMVFGRMPKKTEEDGCTEGVIDFTKNSSIRA